MKKNTKTIMIIVAIVVVIAVVAFFLMRKKSATNNPSTDEQPAEPAAEPTTRDIKIKPDKANGMNVSKEGVKNIIGRVGFYQNSEEHKNKPEADLVAAAAYDAYQAKNITWAELEAIRNGKYTVEALKKAAY